MAVPHKCVPYKPYCKCPSDDQIKLVDEFLIYYFGLSHQMATFHRSGAGEGSESLKARGAISCQGGDAADVKASQGGFQEHLPFALLLFQARLPSHPLCLYSVKLLAAKMYSLDLRGWIRWDTVLSYPLRNLLIQSPLRFKVSTAFRAKSQFLEFFSRMPSTEAL